jgi:chaperone modulatory protein CbpM
MDIVAVTALFPDLTQVELVTWVERGWVLPDAVGGAFEFHEIDVARVRLIHDLRRGMDVREDTIPLVLSLLDQVYDLRAQLNGLLRALATQPAEVRQAVLDALPARPAPSRAGC